MSMSLSYSWSGGGDPLLKLKVSDAVKTWSDGVGPTVLQMLKDETPVYHAPAADPHPRPGGRMRDATRYERTVSGDGATITFRAYVPYAGYVVKGTSPHVIEAVAARHLHFYSDVGGFFRVRVHHPGGRADDYPRRVLDGVRDRLTSSLADEIREMLH